MKFTVKLADLMIDIQSIYPDMQKFCKGYCAERQEGSASDLSVSWTVEEVKAEQDPAEEAYSMEYLETLAALRKISEKLPFYHRFLLHGAAITYADQAYLFTAPSGTGKTTHISLWKKCFGKKVDIVNGDKPILSIESGDAPDTCTARIYGTPWAGKENWQKNRSAKLGGICVVRQGRKNRIRRMTPAEGLDAMIGQIYLPADADAAGLALGLLDSLLRYVPMYLLECDVSEEAVRCSFEAMTGLSYDDSVE